MRGCSVGASQESWHSLADGNILGEYITSNIDPDSVFQEFELQQTTQLRPSKQSLGFTSSQDLNYIIRSSETNTIQVILSDASQRAESGATVADSRQENIRLAVRKSERRACRKYQMSVARLLNTATPTRTKNGNTQYTKIESSERQLDQKKQKRNSTNKSKTCARKNGGSTKKQIPRMCEVKGCIAQARSMGRCKRHGGGKRCTVPSCEKSDQGGGFCIGHGGGKRCAAGGCKNSAQSGGMCKKHGGGIQCSVAGCEKNYQKGGYCRAHSKNQ